MTDIEEVVFAFLRIGIAGNVLKMLLGQISILSAGQHLVGIALVRNVIDDLVPGRIEYIVQCDGRFHHAKIRAEVSAVAAQPEQQCLPHFLGERPQFLSVQLPDILWRIDFFQIHCRSLLIVCQFGSCKLRIGGFSAVWTGSL